MSEIEIEEAVDTIFVRRGDIEVQVTIFAKEPHEGYVRISTGPDAMVRTHPIRVIK